MLSASEGAPDASPENKKPRSKGAASRQRHSVSSRSRGWSDSRSTSSDAQMAHHGRVDLSGRAESQGSSRVFLFYSGLGIVIRNPSMPRPVRPERRSGPGSAVAWSHRAKSSEATHHTRRPHARLMSIEHLSRAAGGCRQPTCGCDVKRCRPGSFAGQRHACSLDRGRRARSCCSGPMD